MSGKSSQKSQNRASSLFRFKKRIVSFFSPDAPAHSSGDDTRRQDLPGRRADIVPPPPSASRHISVSSICENPTAASMSSHTSSNALRSTSELEQSLCQHSLATHLAPVSVPQSPQGREFIFQGSNHTFGGAHNFVMNNPVLNDYSTTADNFMRELLQETIIGAEFDSSARDPPPRCHPGTRLAIIQRCLDFITLCRDEGKLRWVVGPAGVGKSAIMQMVTERVPNGVIFTSIFLSVNGRRDGTKTILTIAYQLAVKRGSYRQFIRDQISLDPSLLRKSLSVQFNKFIVEPFMHEHVFESSRRFLVVIDGLDECDNPVTQRVLLKLITDFCIAYPTSPLVWIIASRPEPHITSFFEKPEVQAAYIKEEIEMDSDEACEDVQRYLREELNKIKLEYSSLRHKREWPLEHEFTTIASAAGGLFAYAATVIRYIDDPHYRDPAAQLRHVLKIIEAGAEDTVAGRKHPMAQLDLLYKRILSDIPDDIMINTRKLLLISSRALFSGGGFRGRCNALGLTEDAAYGAISHLHAVMKIPKPDKADEDPLSYYHKSFEDFLFDFKRSGFSHNFEDESIQLCVQISTGIVDEVSLDADAVAYGENMSLNSGGRVKGLCDKVSLSWPCDERFQLDDKRLQTELYCGAMSWIQYNFHVFHNIYSSISCFNALTTRAVVPDYFFPFYKLRDCAFDEFRDELTKLGKLKQVPLRALDYTAICGRIDLEFTRPIELGSSLSDLCYTSCEHEVKEVGDLPQQRSWLTGFLRYYRVEAGSNDDEDIAIPRFHAATCQQPHKMWSEHDRSQSFDQVICMRCTQTLAHQFMNNPDLLATVFIDSTEMCYVEVSFVDPDDGVSRWRYRLLHSGPPTVDA